ncbi:MAG: sigma-70 family RNA polymerase sigma factor [Bacteroidales bacterium]|nr:sigma-70 family RNA polymerase sigma factor [Bacteroidales bacterium]
MSEISDYDLLEMFKQEDRKHYAFNLLVRKYQKKLYWHIRKLVISHDDTDDLLQNTFLKVWKNLHRFRSDSQLFTWLYRIATNEALNHISKEKRKYSAQHIDDKENHIFNTLESDSYFNGDEIQLKLQKAILTLPEKQRLVFNMKYFDDMKYEEMSEILGTSTGALKASFHIAVKKIEKFLEED